MDVGCYCNRDVVVVEKDASISEIAKLMRTEHVGDVLIVEPSMEGNRPIGIITDRDLVLEVLADNLDAKSVVAGDFMSLDLVSAVETNDLLETIEQMNTYGVRRIPIVDEQGILLGIFAADDALELVAEQVSGLVKLRQQAHTEEKRRFAD